MGNETDNVEAAPRAQVHATIILRSSAVILCNNSFLGMGEAG
jgi:hypothetical protein